MVEPLIANPSHVSQETKLKSNCYKQRLYILGSLLLSIPIVPRYCTFSTGCCVRAYMDSDQHDPYSPIFTGGY